MPSNTFDKTNLGSAVTTKEQVLSGASLIEPESTPLGSSLDSITLKSTSQSWNLDSYSAPRITPVAEGKNPSSYEDAYDQLGQVFNFTHTLERTGQLTDDFMLTDSYADTSYQRAKMKKAVEINRDKEMLLFSAQVRSAGSKGGAARTTESLVGQLTAASTVFADAPEYIIPAAQVVTNTAPTEVTINAALRSVKDESGADASLVVYADSAWMDALTKNVLRISDATNANLNVNLDGKDATVPLRLKVYDGPHGKVTFVNTNSKCSSDPTNLDTALFLDRSKAKLGYLGPQLRIQDEPEYLGTKEFAMRCKVMPMVLNPKAMINWNGIA